MQKVFATLILAACGGGDSATTDTGAGDDDDAVGGLTEDAFGDQFVDRYCDEWAACNPSTEYECPLPSDATVTTTSDCDFDPVAAQLCLDGTYTCDTSLGVGVVIPPDVCCNVCGDCAGTMQ